MTTFIEQQVEALIVAALTTALAGKAVVTGFHQPSVAGTVKAATLSGVLVKVSPRANPTFGTRQCTLNVFIGCRVDAGESPTGDLLSEIEAPVIAALDAWHADPAAMSAALSVSGAFDADAFMFSDGGDCDFDVTELYWYTNVMLQIKGRII